jgi:hypothetical protein
MGNKGSGTYVSSHARYQLLWLGCKIPIFVCQMYLTNNGIKKYRSEILHQDVGYEFLVSKPELLSVKYLIHYKIIGNGYFPDVEKNRSVYVRHGNFGCHRCDIKKIRCDCPINI